jgi:peptidyl-prolyl cis-trans isomerase C
LVFVLPRSASLQPTDEIATCLAGLAMFDAMPEYRGSFFIPVWGAFMNQCWKAPVLIALLVLLLTACGEKKAMGPAAVMVNDEPISVAEVDDRMERLGQSRSAGHRVSGKMIESMVEKELLRQAAVKEKLDEDARVRASLAEASRMILASAYMQKQIAAVPKPGEAEVKEYFNQHPERFADRKVYTLQELTIQTSPDTAKGIKAKLDAGATLDEFMRWLNEKKIENSNRQRVTSSDRMLEEVAQKFKTAKVGEAITLADNDHLTVLFVTAMEPEPLTLEQASAKIERLIYNKSLVERTENAIKQLREQAKIEYVPPYTEHGSTEVKEEE